MQPTDAQSRRRDGRRRPPDRHHYRATWTWRCRARRASIRELRPCGTADDLERRSHRAGKSETSRGIDQRLEINVGWPGQIRLMPEHGDVAGTGFEPDVDDIGLFAEFSSATFAALGSSGKCVGFGRIPGIGAEAAEEI